MTGPVRLKNLTLYYEKKVRDKRTTNQPRVRLKAAASRIGRANPGQWFVRPHILSQTFKSRNAPLGEYFLPM